MCLALLTTLPFGSSLTLLSLYLFPCMLTPTLEVVFTQLDQPAVMFSLLRVQRRLRCSLGTRGASRLFQVPRLKPSSFLFHLLSSPMPCLCLKFGSSLSLGKVCGVGKTMRHELPLSRRTSPRSSVTFPRRTGSTWPACVRPYTVIKLSYTNTSEQRSDPLTKALSVQKWSHALDLLSIFTQRLPDFPVSE